MMLERELRVIHELLHGKRHHVPDHTLATLLATLEASLREFVTLVEASGLTDNELEPLPHIVTLATQVCSDCVPYAVSADQRIWLDRITDAALAMRPALTKHTEKIHTGAEA